MQTTCRVAPKLPKRARHNQTVCDRDGNLWRYDAPTNSWTGLGTLEQPPPVTESSDGLVTPDVYARLLALRESVADGIPLEIKLRPHLSSYWYLFHSSDKYITFSYEGIVDSVSRLRIEVDQSRLYAAMMMATCRGPRGQKGPKGLRGPDGRLSPEPCFQPTSVNGPEMGFNVTVETPLTTDVLLRLAVSNTAVPALTIAISADDTKTLISNNITQLDAEATVNDIVITRRGAGSLVLSGSFVLSSGSWADPGLSDLRCILARQKGPVGDKGDPGRFFPATIECPLEGDEIRYTTPIMTIRRGCDPGQLLAVPLPPLGEACVSKLTLDVSSPDYPNIFSGSAVDGRMLALKRDTSACKTIGVYKPKLETVARPTLELPDWRPQGGCDTSKRSQMTDMNWTPATSSGPDWQVPTARDGSGNNSGVASSQYPWDTGISSSSSQGQDGGCDPCGQSGNSNTPPCPSNDPDELAVTTTTTAPVTYQLRSNDGDCDCVSSDVGIAAGDVVINSYQTTQECEAAKINICGGGNADGGAGNADAGVVYQLRKDFATGQCACLNANDPYGPMQETLEMFVSLAECEAARTTNPNCS